MYSFAELTPHTVLSVLEEVLGKALTSFTQALPSYINRVFEIRDFDDVAYVAKFYRPGRWSREAIEDEHVFLEDCKEYDLPVVSPLPLSNGSTLYEYNGMFIAVFPRKAGRDFELYDEENWIRIGSLLGRLHNVGAQQRAPHRLTLTPEKTTEKYLETLLDIIPANQKQSYEDVGRRIIDAVLPPFEGLQRIRIHGDFHMGNILHRMEQGLQIIDFDDMMNGPAVQDFWLLLPDHYPASRQYLDLLVQGYDQFREVDFTSFSLIEGLRAMRMIYFTAWTAMQCDDPNFHQQYPHWGSEGFWSREISDLHMQFGYIQDSLQPQW